VASLRRLWYFHLHPGRLCRKFVPDRSKGGWHGGVYCRACGYDRDLHRLHPGGLREGVDPLA